MCSYNSYHACTLRKKHMYTNYFICWCPGGFSTAVQLLLCHSSLSITLLRNCPIGCLCGLFFSWLWQFLIFASDRCIAVDEYNGENESRSFRLRTFYMEILTSGISLVSADLIFCNCSGTGSTSVVVLGWCLKMPSRNSMGQDSGTSGSFAMLFSSLARKSFHHCWSTVLRAAYLVMSFFMVGRSSFVPFGSTSLGIPSGIP